MGLEFQIIWDREGTSEWNDYLDEVATVYRKYHLRWLQNRVWAACVARLM